MGERRPFFYLADTAWELLVVNFEGMGQNVCADYGLIHAQEKKKYLRFFDRERNHW